MNNVVIYASHKNCVLYNLQTFLEIFIEKRLFCNTISSFIGIAVFDFVIGTNYIIYIMEINWQAPS